MKITVSPIVFVFFVAVISFSFIAFTEKPGGRTAVAARAVEDASPASSTAKNSRCDSGNSALLAIPPFIVQDTLNDSPGTNLVTRIVIFTAEIGGSPPPFLQWKVDKGSGYREIPGATNATYRIANAQVEHNGLYALFATNAVGATNTSPQRLIVTEGED